VGFTKILRDLLSPVLKARFGKGNRSKQRVTVFPFKSVVYDKLPLGRILNDPELRTDLPPLASQALADVGSLCVGFSYSKPLGLRFCNAAKVARTMTATEAANLQTRTCQCQRHFDEYKRRGWIPAGHTHVVSCDPKFLQIKISNPPSSCSTEQRQSL
jgi:hypothetical protein